MKFQCSIRFHGLSPIRNISYLLPMCCSFWEKCINSQKNGLGCSTPLMKRGLWSRLFQGLTILGGGRVYASTSVHICLTRGFQNISLWGVALLRGKTTLNRNLRRLCPFCHVCVSLSTDWLWPIRHILWSFTWSLLLSFSPGVKSCM